MKRAPDVYPHIVLSHGFMEYAGVKGLYDTVQEKIKKEKGSYNPENPEHDKLWKQYMKEHYLNWARENKQPENILEQGWQEFLDD